MSSTTRKLDFNRMKQEINLAQYAAQMGFEVEPKKSTSNSISMRYGTSDKIVISKQNGTWVYFSVYDNDDNGTIIDFIHNRTKKSLFEIAGELQVLLDGKPHMPELPLYSKGIEEKQYNPERIIRMFNNCVVVKTHRYLTSRRITANTLQSTRFRNRIYQDSYANAVFPHEQSGRVCGLELRNIGVKLFVRGSRKTAWRSNILPDDSKIVIAESPMDAMSYHELYPDANAFYVATSGGLSPEQVTVLQKYITTNSTITSVLLITDNDSGGDKLTDKLIKSLDEIKFTGLINRHSPPNKGDDWNDVLQTREIK
ncbi:DUF3991 domain-containing protein [bacterium]|nr:DUF3991 domain-containing protein [bacterium]